MDKEKLGKIYNHYGEAHQLIKLVEELQELQQEILKVILANKGSFIFTDNYLELVDEMADVKVLIGQFEHAFELEEVLEDRCEFKINRQLERMNEKS